MTYHLTAEGHVYFTDGCTNIRMYLCGSRIQHTQQRRTTIKAYYDSNVKLAVTVWEWYTTMCELVPPTNCSLPLPLDILIGIKGWEGTAPWVMSAGTKYVRAYNPLYCNKKGIYWELQDADGDWYTTSMPVRPAVIKDVCKAPKPILKPLTPQEWAFKVGTLYEPGSAPRNWDKLLNNTWHTSKPLLERGSFTLTELDAYYELGTMCKWGTPYSQVQCAEGKLHLVGPDCTAIVSTVGNERAAPSEVPMTVLEGYGLKVEVSGNKPKQPLRFWGVGDPTFRIISTDGNETEIPKGLLYVLQDYGYLSNLISTEGGTTMLVKAGLYHNTEKFPRLLMAYSR